MIRSTNSFQFHFYFGCFASRSSKGTITFHSFHWWVLGRAVPAIIETIPTYGANYYTYISYISNFHDNLGIFWPLFFPHDFPCIFHGGFISTAPQVGSQAAQSLRAAATAAASGGAPGAAFVAAGFQGTDQQLPLGSIGTFKPGDLALICIYE